MDEKSPFQKVFTLIKQKSLTFQHRKHFDKKNTREETGIDEKITLKKLVAIMTRYTVYTIHQLCNGKRELKV